MTNYICGQNSISERHFVFLRKAAQLFSPFIRNLLGSDPLDTVQRFCTTTSSRPLPARRERRQKAIAGWTPQVVNWCTIKMQSWRDTNADRTVLVEGKHKCSRIVSWCASLAVFARFSDFWNRRLRCAILHWTLNDATCTLVPARGYFLPPVWYCLLQSCAWTT